MSTSVCRQFLIIGVFAVALFPSVGAGAADAVRDGVDFRYSPQEWQSALCLPDDPQKSLVNKAGELLYHYGGDGREFATRISVEVVSNAVWQKQELYSPRVPIVRTLRAADQLRIVEEAFAVTSPASASRGDLILVHVSNTGSVSRAIAPRLIVDTTLDCRLVGQRVTLNGDETLGASLKMTGFTNRNKTRRAIQLEALSIEPGKSVDFLAFYGPGGAIADSPSTVAQAAAARDGAVAFWEKAPLPYGRIEVPDAGIQALVDSSIRNIWQAGEVKNGMTVFQVGPTSYRGFWVADGAFLLEAATMLGAGQRARDGIACELTHQKPDGRIEVLQNDWKENGIVLWTCARHARLTQDKAWLESVWPKLERTAMFIKKLRQETLTNASPLDDGLMPPGFPDGGIDGVRLEFTNPYWNLAGLHAFIEAAQWLGKDTEAAAWQKEYDDFMAAFRKAAARELRSDAHGNRYLPILMGEEGSKELPQRAQWAFCHAVYPGEIFSKDDPLVTGNLAMLEATEREGMVYGAGWDATGIWNYFASFDGHAWLWQGNGPKAAQILYAYANHAAPVLDWREEQSLRGEQFRKVGDMPHNWASAEFIRLTAHLIELDRGSELHLLEGLPRQWTGPGMRTVLNGLATPFGPLCLSLEMDREGRTATLSFRALASNCEAVVVHLPDGSLRKLSARRAGKLTFEARAGEPG